MQTKLSDYFYRDNDNDQLEVVFNLFKHCNLHCSFCYQSHKSNDIDIKYIENIPRTIEAQLPEILEGKNITSVVYRIMGGEVFSDYLPDSVFQTYKNLVDSLEEVSKKLKLKSEFCFTSNFTFQKTQRVKDFIDNRIYFATSYDPVGRFQNDQQIEQWLKNVKQFKPVCVGITLTKQNIQKYIEDPVHFERLAGQDVCPEYYIYCRNYKTDAPSQDDLYKFFKYCIDNNLIKKSGIYKMLVGKGRFCACNNSCFYKNGKLTFDCVAKGSDLPVEDFGLTDETNTVDGRLKVLLKKHTCMQCKHFKYCRMYCALVMLHKDFSLENCVLARIYDEYMKNDTFLIKKA